MILRLRRFRFVGSCNKRRFLSTAGSAWAERAANPSSKLQIYASTTQDPYLNLSIEHYLLEKSPPESSILFLYTNRPCVVIGRNQNPWVEVNLHALGSCLGRDDQTNNTNGGVGRVDFVRRRSGGGTVFHDGGNVNWSVISPSSGFTRDKHAEMVVRALRSCGVERARVNVRHDIVLDQGPYQAETDHLDYHSTPFTSTDPTSPNTVKVSGSAYKLTRGRALHHGTCLLSSPNLKNIGQYLHSPSRPFIKAKGVESVSSPVANVGIGIDVFKEQVREQFVELYGSESLVDVEEDVGQDALNIEDIKKGINELRAPDWMVDQTPRFTFSTDSMGTSQPPRLHMPSDLPPSTTIHIDSRHGQITEAHFSLTSNPEIAESQAKRFNELLVGRRLRDAWTWHQVLAEMGLREDAEQLRRVASWMQRVLPTNLAKLSEYT